MKVNGVTGIPVPNGDHSVEIGYVILPYGVDREMFVNTCNMNSRVSVVIDRSGSVIHNCLVLDQVYQSLKIPQTTEEVGTPVLLVKTSYNEKPIIVGTLPPTNSPNVYEENVYRKVMSDEKGTFLFNVSLVDGVFLVNVDGLGERKMRVNVNGDEGSGIEVNTNGDLIESINGNISVKSFKQISAEVIDVENEKSTVVTVTPDSTSITSPTTVEVNVTDPEGGGTSKIVIDKESVTLDPSKRMQVKGGAEPIPLGDTLKSILETINSNIDKLKSAWSTGNSAVTPAANGSPAGGGGSAFAAATGAVSSVKAPDLSKLNSEISFTD